MMDYQIYLWERCHFMQFTYCNSCVTLLKVISCLLCKSCSTLLPDFMMSLPNYCFSIISDSMICVLGLHYSLLQTLSVSLVSWVSLYQIPCVFNFLYFLMLCWFLPVSKNSNCYIEMEIHCCGFDPHIVGTNSECTIISKFW